MGFSWQGSVLSLQSSVGRLQSSVGSWQSAVGSWQDSVGSWQLGKGDIFWGRGKGEEQKVLSFGELAVLSWQSSGFSRQWGVGRLQLAGFSWVHKVTSFALLGGGSCLGMKEMPGKEGNVSKRAGLPFKGAARLEFYPAVRFFIIY